MSDDIATRTAALRDEAWKLVEGSTAYSAFKALDQAVADMGGDPLLAKPMTALLGAFAMPRAFAGFATKCAPLRHYGGGEGKPRVSQPEAAEAILREKGIPTSGADLLTELPSKGASVTGANQMVNFTSSLSKSGRFRSVRRDGGYFWWFKDEPLPPGWDESPPMTTELDDLLGGDSDHSSQEGGDGDAPATT